MHALQQRAFPGRPAACLQLRASGASRCRPGRPLLATAPTCGARGKQEPAPSTREREREREAYKYFDEAVVTLRAGDGGDGEAKRSGKAKTVRNFKYQPGRQQPKFIDLPVAEPADGGKGSDVLLYVDLEYDSLLHLHDRKRWTAKRGLDGTAAPLATGDRHRVRRPPAAKALRIPVPPGTVVRSKRSRTLLGDLVRPGQSLLVAEGGRGGLGARKDATPRTPMPKRPKPSDDPDEVQPEVEVLEQQVVATKGESGEEVVLELLLRVVADVGIVGFPNAGKSSLLAAVTRASPEIAPYPFTTLMPNLGVLSHDPNNPAVLADLPGLIEGAHKGRGLGRAFLRHLRRTRGMLVVVDASGEGPVGDYLAVREELRLYNPEYVERPHVLALNKIDLPGVAERLAALQQEFDEAIAEHGERLGVPRAVVPVSALTGEGAQQMLQATRALINEAGDFDGVDWELENDGEGRGGGGPR